MKEQSFDLEINVSSYKTLPLILNVKGKVIPPHRGISDSFGVKLEPDEEEYIEYDSISIIEGDLLDLISEIDGRECAYTWLDKFVYDKLQDLEEAKNHKEFEHE